MIGDSSMWRFEGSLQARRLFRGHADQIIQPVRVQGVGGSSRNARQHHGGESERPCVLLRLRVPRCRRGCVRRGPRWPIREFEIKFTWQIHVLRSHGITARTSRPSGGLRSQRPLGTLHPTSRTSPPLNVRQQQHAATREFEICTYIWPISNSLMQDVLRRP